jgi:hypothetical protein
MLINMNNLTGLERSVKLRKKAVSGLMLALLLAGMLTLAFNVQPVNA